MTATQQPILAVEGVSKRFAGVLALDRVSVDLHPGQVHALVGENGAGKSTLIKVLTGAYQPDEGRILYGGSEVLFRRPLDAQVAGISTIYQEINLVPLLSVARNLFLGREPLTRLRLVDERRMDADAADVLRTFGIDVDVRKPLREVGLGVQQMVAIARAVTAEHRVVIMDEPTSSLEPREVERLIDVVLRLRADGIAVVYVTHRLDEVYRLCDVVTVMRDGRVVHTGSVRELSRLELVSKMLGRSVSEVARARTRFKQHEHETSGKPVLRVRHLERRTVLHDVSLDVRPGEVVGLAGLLGSGRSETVKSIAGVRSLDAGTVEVSGNALPHGSPRAAVAAGLVLIPEDRKVEGIVPNLSVRDNIVLAALPAMARMGILSGHRQDTVVRRLMERLRIKASSPDQKVSELSGGNQQKVLLARALCTQPQALLLDDPTRGIDVGAKAEIQALIGELADGGMGIVLISSELEEVVEGADRIVVLRDGTVVGTLDGDDVDEDRVMDLIAQAADAAAAEEAAAMNVATTGAEP